MIIQCSHCGAPLDVEAGRATTKCTYCDSTNVVEKMRRLHPETPSDWKPPPTWTAPDGTGHTRTLTYHTHRSTRPVVIVVLVVVVLGAAGVVFAIGPGRGGNTLFGEWLSRTCMVDANGDGVLDAAGLLGNPGSTALPLVFVDGRNGKVLWSGGSYDYSHARLVCLGPDAVGLDLPDFHIDFRRARSPDALIRLKLPDRTHEYGVGDGCAELVTASSETVAYSLEGQPVAQCSTHRRRIHLAAGYADQSAISDEVWAESIGEMTYTLTSQSPGTAFITARALRGALPRRPHALDHAAVESYLQTLRALPEIWSVKLPYAEADDGLPGVVIGKHLVTWGIDPRRPDAGGVLIGLNVDNGSVTYAKPQSSSWSKRLFELHSNGAHVVPVWGFGIFAHDPATGERIWNIGGR